MTMNIRKAIDDETLLYTINTDIIPRQDDLISIFNSMDNSIEYTHIQAVRYNYNIITWDNQVLQSVDIFI